MRFSKNLAELAANYETPCFLVDRGLVLEKYQEVKASLPGAEVFYAVKANPHPGILGVLARAGCGFEVSSSLELEGALAAGASPDRIISHNPVKSPDFLARAYQAGVRVFAFDSREELQKVARHAPGSSVVVRVIVSNSGSEWPLCGKYGVDASQALELLRLAPRLGLVPYGVTFHVGSQCLNQDNWVDALFLCRQIWEMAGKQGLALEMLSLGGGLPVHHGKKTPAIREIGARIDRAIRELFPRHKLRLTLEPGRALVGESAVLVTSVIGRARRGSEEWLYLDAGIFNALLEASQGISYEFCTERKGPRRSFTLAGPSCDSLDTICRGVRLPDLELGDRVYVMNAGAYTLSYASSFNGFPPPPVYFIDEL
jgi:ornithine decarboxylase